MSKFGNASIETAEMQHREALDDRPQDRYAGRRKFTGCRECGSVDGMQAVHWKTLEKMSKASIELFNWHELLGRDEYLFYPCRFCNPNRNVPGDFVPLAIDEAMAWFDDPMDPDYEALATKEMNYE